MQTWQAIALAVVEGLTEYLPISSTGHIILSSALMGINEEPFTKDYTVMVQFGAILSVVVLYWQRLIRGRALYRRLLMAFLPAALVGLMIKDQIDLLLGNVTVVAIALILGGIVLILMDRILPATKAGSASSSEASLDQMTDLQALLIGACQCVAFIPGVSRAASTIIGGLWQKLDRQAAAEFSFLLAVPTLTAATGLKGLKYFTHIDAESLHLLLLGNLISFFVGLIAIKGFISYLSQRGFFVFGVYRIILGSLILALMASGRELTLL